MTEITKDEFDSRLQGFTDNLRPNIAGQTKNTLLNEGFLDCFLDIYFNLLTNIKDDGYRQQRAITALNWIFAYYKQYTKEAFIAALKDRLTYDFDHPEPLEPSFLSLVLEDWAENMRRNLEIIYTTLCTAHMGYIIASTTLFFVGLFAGLLPLMLFGLGSLMLIGVGVMINDIITSILKSTLLDSKYNIDDMFSPTGENSAEKKQYVTIPCDKDHQTKAKQDVHLRPWLKHGLFLSQQTVTNEAAESFEPSYASS